MVPIYYSIFDKPIPRISYQATFDLTAVGSWFGEEKFSYIRVFDSKADPHVLPLYIPDKLLAREIAYQITAESVTQTLKKEKKRGWPSFPFRCGLYTLHDLKHAEKEATKFQSVTLATIPNRPFDPKKIVYDALEQAKLSKFEHKEDMFDDLFISTETIGQVRNLAKMKYNDEGLTEFNRLREQRLQTLPLDLLATAPATSSSEPVQQQKEGILVVIKDHKKEHAQMQRKEQEDQQRKSDEEKQRKEKEEQLKREHEEQQKREQEKEKEVSQSQTGTPATSDVNVDTHIDPKLLQEWQQFDSIISGLECSKDTDVSKINDIQNIVSPQVLSETSGPSSAKDVEVIPKDPAHQIILQVEDIPPLDVFYSPRHKAVVRRQRKKRRTDQPSLFPEQTVTGNIVWKEEFNPSDDLMRLSQYAGAYSAATIDKASEVSLLLKTKDQEISTLQTELTEAKQRAEQAEEQLLAQQQINSQLTQQLQAEKEKLTKTQSRGKRNCRKHRHS